MAPLNGNGIEQKTGTTIPDDSAAFLLAERAAYHLLDRKIVDVCILDLRGLSDVCDFFVLGSGLADAQVKAGARAVHDGLLTMSQKPVGVEGETAGRWILMDYVDVVVHVLKPAVRQYYQLERLWGDAHIQAVDADYLCSDVFRRHHPDLIRPPALPEAGSTGWRK